MDHGDHLPGRPRPSGERRKPYRDSADRQRRLHARCGIL